MRLRQFPNKDEFCDLAREHNVIPVCTEVLADMETPVSLLQKVYGSGGPVFLLESVEGGEKWGRYSFLGTSARAHVRVFKNQVEIQQGEAQQQIPHNGDPLTVLKAFMGRYHPAEIAELPRFWGGLVGSINYEMVTFFEAIENDWPEDKALAHFIVSDEVMIFDNIKNTLMCLVIAFPEGTAKAPQAYDDAVARLADLQNLLKKPIENGDPGENQKSIRLRATLPEEAYRERVTKVKEYIRKGDIFQGVISQPFVCEAPKDILSLYRAQRFINPSPYLFFFDFGQGTLVGSSPETMVRLENDVATLRPIAGTRPRGKSEQEDRQLADELLKDAKEKAEHLMLVDLGRNDLGRVAAIGTVQVTDLMIVERYSHVMHLVSNINCDLNDGYDAWDLLRASFPAGTLSGAPKVRAMEIIAELENSPRGPYGGAVGYVSFSGNMDLAITIRTAFVENGRLTVRAGAGIVADSDPETERQETVNKAMAIQKAIELAVG